HEPTGVVLRAAPMLVRDTDSPPDASERLRVPAFEGVIGNVEGVDRAAAGRGLISVLPTDGIIRRIPLVFDVNGTLAPALSIELLRVAQHAEAFHLLTRRAVIKRIAAGDWSTTPEADGAARPYYSRRDPRRFVSAVDVLDGRIDNERLRQKGVLVGVRGLGLADYQNTPLRESITGTEVQAQLLENLLDGTLLFRPAWAWMPESALLLVLGGLLIF